MHVFRTQSLVDNILNKFESIEELVGPLCRRFFECVLYWIYFGYIRSRNFRFFGETRQKATIQHATNTHDITHLLDGV